MQNERHNPIIKICGLTSADDILLCYRLGIRHLGFVVEYPEDVPWNLTRQEAKKLLETVPGGVDTYVVCGGRAEEILRIAHDLKPTAIQIHHRESVEDVARLAETLSHDGIKTFRAVSPATPEDELSALCAIPSLAGLVADSRTPDNAAAHGQRLDTNFYLRLCARFPSTVFLGGGITPENVREITAATRATALDILTGIESTPRRKDESKLRRLLDLTCSRT